MSEVAEGKLAPEFSAQDEQGNTIKLSDFKGKKQVVLYFYPKDDTPGCTIEACNFRDSYAQYQSADTQILGVSFDDASSHQAFKDKFQLPFPLLIDADKKIAQAFGVKGEKYPNRDTILIDKEGIILRIFRDVNPAPHVQEILKVIG